jgi:hypothetical protein
MAEHDQPDTDQERGPSRRKSIMDRRTGLKRRDASTPTNLERRRGPGRRRTDFMRAAEEGEMTQEQFMFVMAIDSFKRVNGLTFPTWTEVLEVIRKLGYRKTMPTELNLGSRVEDWTERADAPSGVSKTSDDEAEAA